MFLVIVYMSIMRRDQGKDEVSISQIKDVIPAVILPQVQHPYITNC